MLTQGNNDVQVSSNFAGVTGHPGQRQAHRRASSPASLGPGVSSSLRGMSLEVEPSASRAAMLVLTSRRASSLSLCARPRFSQLRKRRVSSVTPQDGLRDCSARGCGSKSQACSLTHSLQGCPGVCTAAPGRGRVHAMHDEGGGLTDAAGAVDDSLLAIC